jgi:hypothetical protein
VLDAVVTAPTVRFAPVIALLAAAASGRRRSASPPAADRTRRPAPRARSSLRAAVGFWLITDPGHRRARRRRPHRPSGSPLIAEVAAAWVRPTSPASPPAAGPDETTSATALPSSLACPRPGSGSYRSRRHRRARRVVTCPSVGLTPVVVAAAWVRPLHAGRHPCGPTRRRRHGATGRHLRARGRVSG